MLVRLPRLGLWHWEEGPSEYLAWRPVGIDHRNSTILEETKTLPLEDTHKVLCTLRSRKKRQ